MSRSGFSASSSSLRAAKADRLLRAAVTAFCENARPSRREAIQFDDLCVPLLGSASDETLRFVAAALSETPHAPAALVRRLADMPVEISAPLLMRSPVLTPIDLLALIARHGLAHARAIATRADLDSRILMLIRSIGVAAENPVPRTAEEARHSLRAMMRPAGDAPVREEEEKSAAPCIRWEGEPSLYRKLRSTVLIGAPVLFHTALAGALGIEPAQARAIAEDRDPARLMLALRALALSAEEAFLILQCLRPVRDHRGVAAFVEAWEEIGSDEAGRVAQGWRIAANRDQPAEAVTPGRKAS